MKVKRVYSHSDVNMLTACATLIASAIANVTAISAKRALWTLVFFNALKSRIENAFPDILGVDNAADMRKKTKIVEGIMETSETDLTSFSKQLNRDFRNDKSTLNEILTTLGFKEHYKD